MPTGFAVSTRLPLLKKLGARVFNWLTAASVSVTTDEGNWGGFTFRQIINSSQISNTGLSFVRVTFNSMSTRALTVGAVYIGEQAASGDLYDFQTTPTQILFSGSAGFAIAQNTTQVSDNTAFSIPAGKNIIISVYVSGDATHDGLKKNSAPTGWTNYYILGNDASTQNTTGYTNNGTQALCISLVEVSN